MLMLKTSRILVLHHGGFHHRRRRWVAATAQKTEGVIYRDRMLDLLSNRAFVRHGSEYIVQIIKKYFIKISYISFS